MATRKPSVFARKREIVILVAGGVVLLLAVGISLIKFLNPAPIPQADVEAKYSRAYENWYNQQKKKETEVPAARPEMALLQRMTQDYGTPLNSDNYLFHPSPFILVPKQKEDAYYIGRAVLSAVPGFDTAKVTVTFPDMDTTIQAQSPATGNIENYPHLPQDKLVVRIFRGVKTAGGEVTWGEQTYGAIPSATDPSVFTWEEDKGRIKGVTELSYRAQVQSKVKFIDAAKLNAGSVAEMEPPVPAHTLKGEEAITVTTLAPWSIAIPQIWDETGIDVTVTDLNTNQTKDLGIAKVGAEIGKDDPDPAFHTSYRLINIITVRQFLITIQGNITKIDLQISVMNPVTNGNLVVVPNTSWEADPLAPPAENAAIIDAFVKQVFGELKKVAPNMGGADFDYENNFIANTLWRAVQTFPQQPAGNLKDAFGRDVQRTQYQPADGAAPVTLFPYRFSEDIAEGESVVLHINPTPADGKMMYWVEYSKKNADGKIGDTILTGPYAVAIPKNFDMSPAKKVDRLIGEVISPDVRAKYKAKAFDKAVEPKPPLAPVGTVAVFEKPYLLDARGSATGDDIGMKAQLGGKALALVIQYVDTNITRGAILLEAPVLSRDKFVPAQVAPPAAATPEQVFNQNLAKTLTLAPNPTYDNIDMAGTFVTNATQSSVKIIIDQSVKFEGWDKVKLTLQLSGGSMTVDDFVNKLVEAFNKAIQGNEKANGMIMARENRAATGEIYLKMQAP